MIASTLREKKPRQVIVTAVPVMSYEFIMNICVVYSRASYRVSVDGA